jgi:Lrp/AsnC family leucine-responsive transcriptional regulator
MISLDYARLGYPISAFVRIRAFGPKDRGLVQAMREIPQIIESHSVTGEDCVIARVVVRSVDELSSVLTRISAYGHSSTSIILDTLIPLRNPLPKSDSAATPASDTSGTSKRNGPTRDTRVASRK